MLIQRTDGEVQGLGRHFGITPFRFMGQSAAEQAADAMEIATKNSFELSLRIVARSTAPFVSRKELCHLALKKFARQMTTTGRDWVLRLAIPTWAKQISPRTFRHTSLATRPLAHMPSPHASENAVSAHASNSPTFFEIPSRSENAVSPHAPSCSLMQRAI
jgi:hypothetical protein